MSIFDKVSIFDKCGFSTMSIFDKVSIFDKCGFSTMSIFHKVWIFDMYGFPHVDFPHTVDFPHVDFPQFFSTEKKSTEGPGNTILDPRGARPSAGCGGLSLRFARLRPRRNGPGLTLRSGW